MRIHDVEQFQHNRCNPAEESGTGFPAEVTGFPLHLDVGLEPIWIQIISSRKKQDIRPGGHQRFPVRFQRAWVGAKILVGSKLHRVDEDADDRGVAGGNRFCHQAQMPLVETTHCGDEPNYLALFADPVSPRFHLLDRSDGLQGFGPVAE